MIKIIREEDLSKIKEYDIRQYVSRLLKQLLAEYQDYCTDGTIYSIGAFYVLESANEINNYQEIGLFSPITKTSYEWIDDFNCEYSNMCIVIDTDRAVNIIGKTEYFKKFLEDKI